MDRARIFEIVQEIFRDVFDDQELIITDSTNSDDIEDWDSLNNVNIIVAMEKDFKIKFILPELVSLQNVGEVIDLIERKTK